MDLIPHIPLTLELIVLLAGAVTALLTLHRLVVRPLVALYARINSGMDTLLGYPAVTDPGSGRVIQEPTPPLAARVYDLEETNRKMADALVTLADNQERLTRLEADWEDRRIAGDRIIADFTAWRAQTNLALSRWVSEQDQLAEIVRTTGEEENTR